MEAATPNTALFDEEQPGGVRSAVRFPIALPLRLTTGGAEHEGLTENISANGALLRMNSALQAGASIEFRVEFPAGVLGFGHAASMHCAGRVTRSYQEPPFWFAAVVIDEYRFQ